MKKIAIVLALIVSNLVACTSVFMNKGGYHVVARNMDFAMNMGFNVYLGYVGQKNITDVVLNADAIPQSALMTWQNRYGFFGRAAFNTPVVADGMNTQGLSVAMLYLQGATYPSYNKEDSRQAISIYNLSNYLLSNAKDVAQARELIEKVQIVDGALDSGDGVFVTALPIHHIIRDRAGNTLVVEFMDKKMKIYEGQDLPVVSNAPVLSWQLENAKQYASLKTTNTKPNPEFENRVINYNEIFDAVGVRPTQASLMGLPADYTPPSRFVRPLVLLNNLPAPQNRSMAYAQLQTLINTVIVPPMTLDDITLWTSMQDLDQLKYMVQDHFYFNPDRTLYAFDPTRGYTVYELNNFDFTTIPSAGAPTIQVTPQDKVKKMMKAPSTL